MYVNKFLTFGLSAVLQLAGGVSYAFSLYSPALKESLEYTQVQIQGIGNPLLPTIIFGLLPGLAYDSLQQHNRFGTRLVLGLGAVIHFLGYGGLWLAGTHRVNELPYWVVVGAGVVAMNGAAWTDVACIGTNVRNFAHERGTAIGILKSMMGLSASVYATIYSLTFRPHALSFMLFITACLPTLVLISLPLFNAVPFRQEGELPQTGRFWSNGTRFSLAYTVVGVLAVGMLLATGIDDRPLSVGFRISGVAGIAIILMPLLLLPCGSSGFFAKPIQELEPSIEGCSPSDSPDSSLLERLVSPVEEDDDTPLASELQGEGKQHRHLDTSRAGSLKQLNFWFLYFVFGASAACGLLFLNNCGQIVESLRGPPDGQDSLITLFSVLNCFGRLLFGVVPELALHRWGTPRTLFLVVVSLVMCLGTFLTATASLAMLRLVAPLTGLVFGAQWSLMPALASELFGLRHFGFNYCALSTSVTITSFLVSNMLGGYLYQARLEEHGDRGNVCIGADCFRTTFLAAGSLQILAIVAAAILLFRTRSIYVEEHREIKTEEHVLRSLVTGHRIVPQRAAAAAAVAGSQL